MNVTLIGNARLPSEKAHPWQVVSMWKAFSQIDQATLLYPFRFQDNPIFKSYHRQFWRYYGFDRPFGPAYRLPTIDLVHLLKVWPQIVGVYSRVQQLSFMASLLFWLAPPHRRKTWVWTREILSLPLLSKVYPQLPLFYEMHRFPGSWVERQISWLSCARGVICLTQVLVDRLLATGYPQERILLAPDAYDPDLFSELLSQIQARRSLGLPEQRPCVVYTGHLYPWKGVETVVKAMSQLSDYDFHIVGGMPEDIQRLKQSCQPWPTQVTLYGHRPPTQIPLWLKAADVVVVPNSGQTDLSRYYTSPLKLYEAMASQTPLLVSDLPSLREAVDENCALMVAPDDPEDWRQKILWAFNHLQDMKNLTLRAYEKVHDFTWESRARRIYDFMKRLTS